MTFGASDAAVVTATATHSKQTKVADVTPFLKSGATSIYSVIHFRTTQTRSARDLMSKLRPQLRDRVAVPEKMIASGS